MFMSTVLLNGKHLILSNYWFYLLYYLVIAIIFRFFQQDIDFAFLRLL